MQTLKSSFHFLDSFELYRIKNGVRSFILPRLCLNFHDNIFTPFNIQDRKKCIRKVAGKICKINISLERNPKSGSSRLFMESKSENSAISGIQMQILL